MHLDKKRGLKFRRWISNQPERAILFFFFFLSNSNNNNKRGKTKSPLL
jgi:hypothetical protein